MFFREVRVSDECKNWLEKSKSIKVKPEEADKLFKTRCSEIQSDVLHALITESKEPASPDGKAEVVAEISLVKADKPNVTMVVTNVYAVVYTNMKYKYYVVLDTNGKPKRVFKMSDDIKINVKKGECVEGLKTLKQCKYCISM